MFSDGNKSDGSSDVEAASREKKAHSRTSGKLVEKKKKHEKHKKHKKSKKHKKHRHLSDAESEEKSDDGSVSSVNRKRAPQQAPERQGTREAKADRIGVLKERDPPQERPRQDSREERQPKQASSRWDSPGEGRHLPPSQNYDHSKSSQRTKAQMDGRADSSYHHHDERHHRENNRRRSSPGGRSRSPAAAAEYARGRGEFKQRRRYSHDDHQRGENVGQHDSVSTRHEEHFRGNRNGREYRGASPRQQHHSNRFDDRRPKRNDNYVDYNTGARRTQEYSGGGGGGGGGDNGHQRRFSSPNHSFRGNQEQQQRGRGRMFPGEENNERQHRGDYRNDSRDQRPNRGFNPGQNRGWRGQPDDYDRNRRERVQDREREPPRGGSRPADVKVERPASNPVNPRGRSRSHSPAKQPVKTEPSAPNRHTKERSPIGRGPRREASRANQGNEEDQFEWGGARRDADRRSESKQPHVPRIKGEERRVPKEEPGSDSESNAAPKQKPDFALSGKLTEETNKVNGTVIAYAEPPGARKPKRRWRLYPFKGEQALPTLYIHRQSCYLIGRDRKVCDLPVDHPSCSKQHAVLQYRLVPYQREDGTSSQRVRPYIIDLESANGTFVNSKKIEPKRYLELREKDVLKFGFSSREYVLLHENSKEDNEDDDGYEVSPNSKPFAGANSNVGAN